MSDTADQSPDQPGSDAVDLGDAKIVGDGPNGGVMVQHPDMDQPIELPHEWLGLEKPKAEEPDHSFLSKMGGSAAFPAAGMLGQMTEGTASQDALGAAKNTGEPVTQWPPPPPDGTQPEGNGGGPAAARLAAQTATAAAPEAGTHGKLGAKPAGGGGAGPGLPTLAQDVQINNSATQGQVGGLEEQFAGESAQRKATAPTYEKAVQDAAGIQAAQAKLAQDRQAQYDEFKGSYSKNLDDLHQMAMQKPNPMEWWDNRSTGGQILTGLGMMLMGGEGAAKFVQDSIQNWAKAKQTKFENLKDVGAATKDAYSMSRLHGLDQSTALEAQQLQGEKLALATLQQQRNATQDPIQQGILDQQINKLAQGVALHNEKVTDDASKQNLQNAEAKRTNIEAGLAVPKFNWERQQMGNKLLMPGAGAKGEDLLAKSEGAATEYNDAQAKTHGAIASLNGLKTFIHGNSGLVNYLGSKVPGWGAKESKAAREIHDRAVDSLSALKDSGRVPPQIIQKMLERIPDALNVTGGDEAVIDDMIDELNNHLALKKKATVSAQHQGI